MNAVPGLRKGLRDSCLGADTPVPEVFRLAEHGGFEGVELTLPAEGPFSLRASDEERQELRRLAADSLPILCLNAGLPWQYSPSSLNPEVRKKGHALTRRQHRLGGGPWRGHPCSTSPVSSLTTRRSARSGTPPRAATEALLPQAEAAGVTLAVENVWNALILSPRDMLEFVDGFASPHLRVYFDVGNVMQFGRPQHWIEALGAERIARVHVKDFTLRPGGWLGFTQLLHGDVDWPVVMQTLHRVGYSGWITPEVSPSSASSEAWIAELSAAMDTIIGYYEA